MNVGYFFALLALVNAVLVVTRTRLAFMGGRISGMGEVMDDLGHGCQVDYKSQAAWKEMCWSAVGIVLTVAMAVLATLHLSGVLK